MEESFLLNFLEKGGQGRDWLQVEGFSNVRSPVVQNLWTWCWLSGLKLTYDQDWMELRILHRCQTGTAERLGTAGIWVRHLGSLKHPAVIQEGLASSFTSWASCQGFHLPLASFQKHQWWFAWWVEYRSKNWPSLSPPWWETTKIRNPWWLGT